MAHRSGGADDLAAPREAGAGTWYIRGTTIHGCYSLKPVTVTVNPLPLVVIADPTPLCEPETADLTDPAVTGAPIRTLPGHGTPMPGRGRRWRLPGEAGAGTYYIRGTTIHGCYSVKPVTVTVNPLAGCYHYQQ
jgi:large repetitive protein